MDWHVPSKIMLPQDQQQQQISSKVCSSPSVSSLMRNKDGAQHAWALKRGRVGQASPGLTHMCNLSVQQWLGALLLLRPQLAMRQNHEHGPQLWVGVLLHPLSRPGLWASTGCCEGG
eukprot:858002-Pelagomonas_calceolata.AAC.3